jgi:hypothetical protein
MPKYIIKNGVAKKVNKFKENTNNGNSKNGEASKKLENASMEKIVKLAKKYKIDVEDKTKEELIEEIKSIAK